MWEEEDRRCHCHVPAHLGTNGKQHIPYDVPVICTAGEFGNQLEAGGIKSGLHGTLPATHERTSGQ
jgi:hypothetical protein